MPGTAGIIFPYGNHCELPLFDPGIAVFDGGDIGGGVGGYGFRRRGLAPSSLGESRDGGEDEDRKLESE